MWSIFCFVCLKEPATLKSFPDFPNFCFSLILHMLSQLWYSQIVLTQFEVVSSNHGCVVLGNFSSSTGTLKCSSSYSAYLMLSTCTVWVVNRVQVSSSPWWPVCELRFISLLQASDKEYLIPNSLTSHWQKVLWIRRTK